MAKKKEAKQAKQAKQELEAGLASKVDLQALQLKLEQQAVALGDLRSGLEKTVAALNQLKERNRLR
jgi:hypothetical protein